MLLTDYFRSQRDATWDIALQCGVKYGTIRLPEEDAFELSSLSHLRAVTDRFCAAGITPLVLEPLPNKLHEHIKTGDSMRDASIETFITLMKNLREVGITTVCFNFMAHYGWTRTAFHLPERGGAEVTGFDLRDFKPDSHCLTHGQLWDNYFYFITAVLPYAEEYGIRLALHPDDPPLDALGDTARIFTGLEAIRRAVRTIDSPNLGVTFCQACYYLMGENLEESITELADKIFFIHFRNVCGKKSCFRETFHDNGEINMASVMKMYAENGIDVPIRVDHVPTMAGEHSRTPGYDAVGRMFAIGYLKGIMEGAAQYV